MSDSSGAKSGTSSKMICSLSGQDCADPVVTPSGYICERRLLLSKLVDTGGNDPFRADVVLHESDLVSLQKPKESSLIPPPRLETATSFTHLLQLMQHEHDALLLELYDTRKALEETRMELSQALYQNDAAVRVIARVTMERDQAKQDLMNYQPQAGAVSATPTVGGTSAAPAPSMVVQDEPAAQPAPPEAMQVEEEAGVEPPPTKDNVVPDEDMKLLIDSWQQLSSQRKARKKQKADPAIHSVSPEELGQFQALESKSLHKSNKPGVVALATVGDYVASAGKDKSVIVYSRVKDQILHNLAVPSSSAAFTSVDIVQIPTTIDKSPSLQTLVATGDASGAVRCYAELTDPEDGSSVMRPLGDVKSGLGLSEEKESVVSVAFHPSGKFIFATTANGHVTMIKIVQPSESVADGTMEILMTLNSLDQLQLEKELRVTAGALHPDGLIYLVGLSDGSLQVWDLKTQSLASTLTEHKGSVTSLSFNDNGYNFASSSDAGEVVVWDLRKGKMVATINKEGDDDIMEGGMDAVEFDSTGKYLAYASQAGVRVVMMKEWDKVLLNISTTGFKAAKGRAAKPHVALGWSGSLSTCFVLGCTNDRALKFFGSPAAIAAEE